MEEVTVRFQPRGKNITQKEGIFPYRVLTPPPNPPINIFFIL